MQQSDNPYASPRSKESAAATVTPLVVSSITVFACSLAGGVLGLVIGTLLGLLVPGYYRSVFPHGADPHFDPVAVGIGQGLTQGIVLGAIIGLLVVALFYWNRSRSLKASNHVEGQ